MIYDNIHNLSHFKTGRRREGVYMSYLSTGIICKRNLLINNYNWRRKVKNNYYCVLDYVMLYGGYKKSLHTRYTYFVQKLVCTDIIIELYSVWGGCTMSQSIACFIFGFSLAPCHVRRPHRSNSTDSSFTCFIHHAQLIFILLLLYYTY